MQELLGTGVYFCKLEVSFPIQRYVKVDVYFTAVGMIDIPTEQEILAMKEEMQKNPQQFRFIA